MIILLGIELISTLMRFSLRRQTYEILRSWKLSLSDEIDHFPMIRQICPIIL